jgi:protein N-terminal methyltransferase
MQCGTEWYVLTRDRSSNKWLEIFRDAGLEVIKEEVQIGMPSELFVVKA